jgi:hypothetical protein
MWADLELLLKKEHLPYVDYALALDCLKGHDAVP